MRAIVAMGLGLAACAAAPDLNAVEDTTGKVEQCQAEARAAHDACEAGQCNVAAMQAYADCKKRLGLP